MDGDFKEILGMISELVTEMEAKRGAERTKKVTTALEEMMRILHELEPEEVISIVNFIQKLARNAMGPEQPS